MLTVAQLRDLYTPFAEQHYRRSDGTPTGEADSMKSAIDRVCDLYGDTAVSDFSPSMLRDVRQRMIDDGIARTSCNQRVNRIRRFFSAAKPGTLCAESWTSVTAGYRAGATSPTRKRR